MLRLAICGPGRCGKDTAAEYLSTITPLRYVAGTSKFAAGIVWERWGKFQVKPVKGTYETDFRVTYIQKYRNAEQCWQDRHNHRETWARIIGEYNTSDPVALYRDCLAEQDVLTGLRWAHEQAACRAAGLVDIWIWIDRRGITADCTMEYTADDCDVVIPNNGTLEEFKRRLDAFAKCLRFENVGTCLSG